MSADAGLGRGGTGSGGADTDVAAGAASGSARQAGALWTGVAGRALWTGTAGRPGGKSADRPALVIGLLGPTGVGKTVVALEVARRLSEAWPARATSVACPGQAAAADRDRVEAAGDIHTAVTGDAPIALTGDGQTAPAGDALAALAGGEAAARRGRIISCDSMQVYRDFPVLTNQPAVDENEAIGHALVGFVEPAEEFSVAQYSALVRPLIDEDLSARGWALLAGGTGLYMRAALAPLAVAPGGDAELRARLAARAASEGIDVLHAELASLDPEAAAKIDRRNRRRVIRALEAISVSGRRWSGRGDLWTPDYYHPTLLVGLVTERTELSRRIDLRAVEMLRQGAVEEVRRFREVRGFDDTRPGGPGVRSAIGYPEICRLLDGEQTLEETVAQVAAATRRYARRQLTWLRKLEDAVIIDAQDRDSGDVAEEILGLALSGDRTRGSHHS